MDNTNGRGCKRTHIPVWADLVENENTLAGMCEQKILLACWNMPLQTDVLGSWRRREDSINVRTALQLLETEWPGEILELVLLEVVQIGVPLAVGIPIDEYIADRFSVTLLVCTGPASLAVAPRFWYCRQDTKGKRAGYARALVMRVAFLSDHFSFGVLPELPAISLGALVREHQNKHFLVSTLAQTANAHESYTTAFVAMLLQKRKGAEQRECSRAETYKGLFAEEFKRCTEVLKVCERVRHARGCALSMCPLQLGISDVSEWMSSTDPCRMCKEGATLSDLLNNACECGLMSFKLYYRGRTRLSKLIPEQEWPGVVLHMVRERCMQQFLSGKLVFLGEGTIVADESGELRGIHFDAGTPSVCDWSTSFKNHLCFIAEEPLFDHSFKKHWDANILHILSAQARSEVNVRHTLQEFTSSLPWPSLYSTGTFRLCQGWSDINHSYLRLRDNVKQPGRVRVIVGEYVGSWVHIVDIVAKTKLVTATPAVRDLLGSHCDIAMRENPAHNFLWELTLETVDAVVAQDGLTCTSEQRDYIKNVACKKTALIPTMAVPGATKLSVGVSIASAVKGKLKKDEKILWLAKTKEQRDALIRNARRRKTYSLKVCGLGRSLDNVETVDDDWQLDSDSGELVADCLKPFTDELERLQKELKEYTRSTDVVSNEGAQRKKRVEDLKLLAVQRYAAKLQAWKDVMQNVDMFVLTADAFLEIKSGSSFVSKLFVPFTFVLAFLDEGGALEFPVAYAIACHVRTLVMFWEKAQHIEEFKSGNALALRAKESTNGFYAWQKGVTGCVFIHVWDFLDDRDIIGLGVT